MDSTLNNVLQGSRQYFEDLAPKTPATVPTAHTHSAVPPISMTEAAVTTEKTSDNAFNYQPQQCSITSSGNTSKTNTATTVNANAFWPPVASPAQTQYHHDRHLSQISTSTSNQYCPISQTQLHQPHQTHRPQQPQQQQLQEQQSQQQLPPPTLQYFSPYAQSFQNFHYSSSSSPLFNYQKQSTFSESVSASPVTAPHPKHHSPFAYHDLQSQSTPPIKSQQALNPYSYQQSAAAVAATAHLLYSQNFPAQPFALSQQPPPPPPPPHHGHQQSLVGYTNSQRSVDKLVPQREQQQQPSLNTATITASADRAIPTMTTTLSSFSGDVSLQNRHSDQSRGQKPNLQSQVPHNSYQSSEPGAIANTYYQSSEYAQVQKSTLPTLPTNYFSDSREYGQQQQRPPQQKEQQQSQMVYSLPLKKQLLQPLAPPQKSSLSSLSGPPETTTLLTSSNATNPASAPETCLNNNTSIEQKSILNKRESPLDLSVKTVRTSADSTALVDDSEAFANRSSSHSFLNRSYVNSPFTPPASRLPILTSATFDAAHTAATRDQFPLSQSHTSGSSAVTTAIPAAETGAASAVDKYRQLFRNQQQHHQQLHQNSQSSSKLSTSSNSNVSDWLISQQRHFEEKQPQSFEEYRSNQGQHPQQQPEQQHRQQSPRLSSVPKSRHLCAPKKRPIDYNNGSLSNFPINKFMKSENWRQVIDQQIEEKLSTHTHNFQSTTYSPSANATSQLEKISMKPNEAASVEPKKKLQSDRDRKSSSTNPTAVAFSADNYFQSFCDKSNMAPVTQAAPLTNANLAVNKTVLNLLRNSLESKEAQKRLDSNANDIQNRMPHNTVNTTAAVTATATATVNALLPTISSPANRLQSIPLNQPFEKNFDQFAANNKQPLNKFYENAELLRNSPSNSGRANSASGSIPSSSSQVSDLDGYAALWASRIPTKAELKQLTGSMQSQLQQPQLQQPQPQILTAPKIRKRQISVASCEDERRNHQDHHHHQQQQQQQQQFADTLISPSTINQQISRNIPVAERSLLTQAVSAAVTDSYPSTLICGSSTPKKRLLMNNDIHGFSETSIFDFHESDSENEAPVLEKPTLNLLRKDRKKSSSSGQVSQKNSLKILQDQNVSHNLNQINFQQFVNKSSPNLSLVAASAGKFTDSATTKSTITENKCSDNALDSVCNKFLQKLKTAGGVKKRGRRKSEHEANQEIKLETDSRNGEVLTSEKLAKHSRNVKEEADVTSACARNLLFSKTGIVDETKLECDAFSGTEAVKTLTMTMAMAIATATSNAVAGSLKKSENVLKGAITSRGSGSAGGSSSSSSFSNSSSGIGSGSAGSSASNAKCNSKSYLDMSSLDSDSKDIIYYPGWEAELYNYKKSLRMPVQLINIKRPSHWPKISLSLPDLDPFPNSPCSSSLSVTTDNALESLSVPAEKVEDAATGPASIENRLGSFAGSATTATNTYQKHSSIIEILAERYGTLKKSKLFESNPTKLKTIKKSIKMVKNLPELLPTPFLNNYRANYLSRHSGEDASSINNAVIVDAELFSQNAPKLGFSPNAKVFRTSASFQEVFGDNRPPSAPPFLLLDSDQRFQKAAIADKRHFIKELRSRKKPLGDFSNGSSLHPHSSSSSSLKFDYLYSKKFLYFYSILNSRGENENSDKKATITSNVTKASANVKSVANTTVNSDHFSLSECKEGGALGVMEKTEAAASRTKGEHGMDEDEGVLDEDDGDEDDDDDEQRMAVTKSASQFHADEESFRLNQMPSQINPVKRPKFRRKFRSGFDYIRKKKKQPQSGVPANNHHISNSDAKKAVLNDLAATNSTSCAANNRKREKSFNGPYSVSDLQKEIKSWVLNKGVGETYLHKASRLGYTDAVACCLETMAMNPCVKDNAGYTALHEACARGYLDVAKILLLYGANVSEPAQGGIRPLHEAAENGYVEIVRLLLSYGADMFLATYAGQTPLSLANDTVTKTLLNNHLLDIEGKRAPCWHFDGPASCFDSKWTGFDVFDSIPPPSDTATAQEVACDPDLEIEIEMSGQPLPNTYTFINEKPEPRTTTPSTASSSSGRWMILSELLQAVKLKTKDGLLRHVNGLRQQFHLDRIDEVDIVRELKMKDFLENVQCNQLFCVGEKINIKSPKILLVRLIDEIEQLLCIEKVSVPNR